MKPAAERAAFVERACGDDAALRRRIEELLAAHENVDPFLERPRGVRNLIKPDEHRCFPGSESAYWT